MATPCPPLQWNVTERTRIAIIGGGIAGLAAARRLQNHPTVDVTLFERSPRLGGKIVTDRPSGFVIEGGPDSFLSSRPRGVGLSEELGIASRLHGTIPELRRTYVLHSGSLYEMPEGLSGLVPARLDPLLASPLFTDEGKARLAAESEIPPAPGSQDESLASFMSRRFGTEVYERLIEPLMAGIYAGDGRALGLLATFPQLRELEREHGSLLKAMSLRRGPPSPRPAFLTFPTGMAELPEALAASLRRVRIVTGIGVRSLTRPGPYHLSLDNGAGAAFDAVLLATPAPVTASLLSDIAPDAAGELAAIPSVSSVTISLGYHRDNIPHDLHGYGYVVPRIENRPILASTWASSKFPHRAPRDFALIRLFLGRAGHDEIVHAPDSEILSLARDELRGMLGIEAAPVLTRIFRWPLAMPQYTVGHLDRMERLRAALAAHPSLAVAGNAYQGVGIPDVIRSGEEAADALAAQ